MVEKKRICTVSYLNKKNSYLVSIILKRTHEQIYKKKFGTF